MSRLLVAACLCIIYASLLVTAEFKGKDELKGQAVIHRVANGPSPRDNAYISFTGGARMYIIGSGFSETHDNKVWVGLQQAEVIPYLSTSTQIVFIAPPSPSPETNYLSQKIEVLVDGLHWAKCRRYCTLLYHASYKPHTDRQIDPQALSDGAIGYWGGRTKLYQLDQERLDVRIGDQRCSLGEDTNDLNNFESRYNLWEFTHFKCRLSAEDFLGPANASFTTLHLGRNDVDNPNFSSIRQNYYRTHPRDGTPYHVMVSPSIVAIHPSIASVAGGNIITIRGTGFGNNPSVVDIHLGGVPCRVQAIASDFLTCKLGDLRTIKASSGASMHISSSDVLLSQDVSSRQCWLHKECSSGHCLPDGSCAPDCQANADCPSNRACTASGKCVELVNSNSRDSWHLFSSNQSAMFSGNAGSRRDTWHGSARGHDYKYHEYLRNNGLHIPPVLSQWVASVETKDWYGRNYYVEGFTGFFVPLADGNYTFGMSSDSHGLLNISLTGHPDDQFEVIRHTNGNPGYDLASKTWWGPNPWSQQQFYMKAGQKIWYNAQYNEDHWRGGLVLATKRSGPEGFAANRRNRIRPGQVIEINVPFKRETHRVLLKRATGGTFRLVYKDTDSDGNARSATTRDIAFDTTWHPLLVAINDLRRAGHIHVRQLTQSDHSIASDEIGWDIYWDDLYESQHQLFQIQTTGLNCAPGGCEASVTRVVEGSPPLRGTFTVSFKGSTTPPIQHNVRASQLAEILQELPTWPRDSGGNRAAEADGRGDSWFGTDFRVFFNSATGSVDELMSVDVSGLSGGDAQQGPPTGRVYKFDRGCNSTVVDAPLDTTQLVTAHTTPQLVLTVRGIPSICNVTKQGECSVFPSEGRTAVIKSVQSSTVAGRTTLSITGSYFDEQPEVLLGKTPCIVSSWSPESISCSFTRMHFGPAGNHTLGVTLPSSGAAVGVRFVDTAVLELTSVSPSSPIRAQGVQFTCRGKGFGNERASIGARVAGIPATVVSVSNNTELVVSMPNVPFSQCGQTVQIETFVRISGSANIFSSLQTTLDCDSVMSVKSIHPTIGSAVASTQITLFGSAFGNHLSLHVGRTESHILSSNSTTIIAVVAPDEIGVRNISLTDADKGQAEIAGFSFSHQLVMHHVRPSVGSLSGSQVLTISGEGFSTSTQNVLVTIDGVICDVSEVTFTSVTCVTRPASKNAANTQTTVLVSSMNRAAKCSNSSNCLFLHSSTHTPEISAAGTSEGLIPIEQYGQQLSFSLPDVANSPTTASVVYFVIGNSSTSPLPAGPSVTAKLPKCSVSGGKCVVPPMLLQGIYFLVAQTEWGFSSPSIHVRVPFKLVSTSAPVIQIRGAVPKLRFLGISPDNITSLSIRAGADECRGLFLDASNFVRCRLHVGRSGNQHWTATLQGNPPQVSQVPFIVSGSMGTSTDWAVAVDGSWAAASLNPMHANLKLNVFHDDTTYLIAQIPITNIETDGRANFTLPSLEHGRFYLQVSLNDSLYDSTRSFSTNVQIQNVIPTASTLAGGSTITINGFHLPLPSGVLNKQLFPRGLYDAKVLVCGRPCNKVEAVAGGISCSAPAVVFNDTGASLWPSIGTLHSYGKLGCEKTNCLYRTDVWTDSRVDTVQNTDDNGYVNFIANEGIEFLLDRIEFIPSIFDSTIGVFMEGVTLLGSTDGNSWTLLSTFAAAAHVGWNDWSVTSSSRFTHYRIRSRQSSRLSFAEVRFVGRAFSLVNSPGRCSVSVELIPQNSGYSALVVDSPPPDLQYDLDASPIISGISPSFASSSGGELVTFSGQRLHSAVRVEIDGIQCIITSSSSQQVVCRTGYRPRPSSPEINLWSSAGRATIQDGVRFLYAELWSSAVTWGGLSSPLQGESVHIPAGKHVILDVSPPPLNLLLVEGSLVFKQGANISVDCHFIFINRGRMQIGTEQEPFSGNAEITLRGHPQTTARLPGYGAKNIAVRFGTLDMHGLPTTPTWTKLDATVLPSNDTIKLADEVNWIVGQQIAIAPSDFAFDESEKVTITSVANDKKTLAITPPLRYRHSGIQQTVNGKLIDMRAEVGLLSRNIRVQGDQQSEDTKFGAHIMAHSPGSGTSEMRLSNVECFRCGQAHQLGRYPFHIHMMNFVELSYVRNCSVHHSFNRGTTIHGVHALRVQNNVYFDIMGHAVFVEDGIESLNRIENNLVITVRRSGSLLNTDTTPACFWITHPNNFVNGNAAAGCQRYGFWYDLPVHPTGPSATESICPKGEKFGSFEGNSAHSVGRYGLRIFDQYIPRQRPCYPGPDLFNDLQAKEWKNWDENPPVEARFKSFTAYKSGRVGAIGSIIGAVVFDDFRIADSARAGIEVSLINAPPMVSKTVNATIVGASQNQFGDIQPVTLEGETGIFGFIAPREEHYSVEGMHLQDLDRFNMSSFGSCSHCMFLTTRDNGARTTSFKGMSFKNVPKRVQWGYPFKAISKDVDGSLTGLPGSQPRWATPFYHFNHIPGTCDISESWDGSLLCNDDVSVHRFTMWSTQPSTVWISLNLHIRRELPPAVNQTVSEPPLNSSIIAFEEKCCPDKGWAAPLASGNVYQMWTNTSVAVDFEETLLQVTKLEPGQHLYVRFNYTNYRDHFTIRRFDDGTEIPGSTLAMPSPLATYGSFYHDKRGKAITILFSGNGKPGVLRVLAHKCPASGCPLPPTSDGIKEPFIRLWSNSSQWPNNTLPKPNQDVVIKSQWRMKLDMDPPVLGTLSVLGDLTFDEEREAAHLQAHGIVIRGGSIKAGQPGSPFPGKIRITLAGNRASPTIRVDNSINSGNKVMVVLGELSLFGIPRKTYRSRLALPASAGSNTISLSSDADWIVGDKIVITSTDADIARNEERTIIAVDGSVFTLNAPLQFSHFGASGSTEVSQGEYIDYRAYVALLSRHIVIDGESGNEAWGGHVLVTTFQDEEFLRRGVVNLNAVEFNNIAKTTSIHAGLRFVNAPANASYLRDCSLHFAHYIAVSVEGTDGVGLFSNTVFDSFKSGIDLSGSQQHTILKGNLVVQTKQICDSEPGCEQIEMITNYGICWAGFGRCYNLVIEDNIGVSSSVFNFVLLANKCDESKRENRILNNLAIAARVGFWLQPNYWQCNHFSNFTSIHSMEYGVFSMRPSLNFIVENFKVSDAWVGASINQIHEFDWHQVIIKNAVIVGHGPAPGCGYDFAGPAFCHTHGQRQVQQNCRGRNGLMQSHFGQHDNPAFKWLPITLPYLPWHKAKADGAFGGRMEVEDVTFANFNASDDCQNRNRAFISNPTEADYSPPVSFKNIKWHRVPDSAKLWTEPPDQKWANPTDCEDFVCTAPYNNVLKDLDGTFSGATDGQSRHIVAHNFELVKEDTACNRRLDWNAWQCGPRPYEIVVFESLDADSRSRRLSPVSLQSVSGPPSRNILNSMKDHGWELFYTSLLRRSRFPAAVVKGEHYNLTFSSTNPRDLRFHMRDAHASQPGVLFTLQFQTPEQVRVYIDNEKVEESAAGTVLDPSSDVTGSNVYDLRGPYRLTFLLRGSKILKIKTLATVQVSLQLVQTVDDFYSSGGPISFANKMAFVLGIDASRVRVVSVKSAVVGRRRLLTDAIDVDFVVTEPEPVLKTTTAAPTLPPTTAAPGVTSAPGPSASQPPSTAAPSPVPPPANAAEGDGSFEPAPASTGFSMLKAGLSSIANQIAAKASSNELGLNSSVASVQTKLSLPPPAPCVPGCLSNSHCDDGRCLCDAGFVLHFPQTDRCTAPRVPLQANGTHFLLVHDGEDAFVHWSAPAWNGGSPITAYQVTVSVGSLSFTRRVSAPTTSLKIPSSVAESVGKVVRLQVEAFNQLGSSGAGPAISLGVRKYRISRPSVPSLLSSIGQGKLSLRVTPRTPLSLGGIQSAADLTLDMKVQGDNTESVVYSGNWIPYFSFPVTMGSNLLVSYRVGNGAFSSEWSLPARFSADGSAVTLPPVAVASASPSGQGLQINITQAARILGGLTTVGGRLVQVFQKSGKNFAMIKSLNMSVDSQSHEFNASQFTFKSLRVRVAPITEHGVGRWSGWTVPVIMKPFCDASTTCGGQGSCSIRTGQCLCNRAFMGKRCELCATGRSGSNCQSLGTCSRAQSCSGHGDCVMQRSGLTSCACDRGYFGSDCSRAARKLARNLQKISIDGGLVQSNAGKLRIPAGALPTSLDIAAEEFDKADIQLSNSSREIASNVLDLQPEGVTFDTPVDLELQSASPSASQRAFIATYNAETGAWDEVASTVQSNPDGSISVTAALHHFSLYVVMMETTAHANQNPSPSTSDARASDNGTEEDKSSATPLWILTASVAGVAAAVVAAAIITAMIRKRREQLRLEQRMQIKLRDSKMLSEMSLSRERSRPSPAPSPGVLGRKPGTPNTPGTPGLSSHTNSPGSVTGDGLSVSAMTPIQVDAPGLNEVPGQLEFSPVAAVPAPDANDLIKPHPPGFQNKLPPIRPMRVKIPRKSSYKGDK